MKFFLSIGGNPFRLPCDTSGQSLQTPLLHIKSILPPIFSLANGTNKTTRETPGGPKCLCGINLMLSRPKIRWHRAPLKLYSATRTRSNCGWALCLDPSQPFWGPCGPPKSLRPPFKNRSWRYELNLSPGILLACTFWTAAYQGPIESLPLVNRSARDHKNGSNNFLA